jgi:hypothetical protein
MRRLWWIGSFLLCNCNTPVEVQQTGPLVPAPASSSSADDPAAETSGAPTDPSTSGTAETTDDSDSGSSGAGAVDESSGGGPMSEPLFAIDFDGDPLGPYTSEQLAIDWNSPPWNQGVDDGRVTIIEGSQAYAGRALQVRYDEGGVGPGEGGAQWRLEFDQPYDEVYLRYRVRFAEDFDFVRGGKLPGLVGGEANTGCDPAQGDDGFSARMMWRSDGKVVQYVYHADQANDCGDDFDWDVGGQRFFEPGQWHTVEHRVVINTPGEADGIVQGWFDGELALDRDDVRFRDVDAFAVDALYFSTFFGGSGSEWAPDKDEYVSFDEFVIALEPIGAQ